MSERIADDREIRTMTVQDADALHLSIALLTVRINKILAGYEKKIAELKANADADVASLRDVLKQDAGRLAQYILLHGERFVKPRQRKTDYGKYGLRTVSNVEILDEASALISCKAQQIPAVIVSERLDKKALEKALTDGLTIAGVELRTGEVASYTVDKSLMEE